MLWRALKHINQGLYIDVGAADPDHDSVTRAFHERGWQGVNIEPAPDHFAALARARPQDVNLRCLAGAASGQGVLHHFAGTGLSTTNASYAAAHTAEGRVAELLHLPVRTLADICAECVSGDIHFLKIDVEGAEADVLRGMDFTTWRPWIVVVEATEPDRPTESWQGWNPLLTDNHYQFAWFDGLNRFYLAVERAGALEHAFHTPPNVFDLWVRPAGQETQALQEHCREVEALARAAQEEAASAHSALAIAKAHATALAAERDAALLARRQTEAAYAAVLNSTCWRLTAPLRAIVDSARSNDVRTFRKPKRPEQITPFRSGSVARLRHVAGPGKLGLKGLSRIGFYGLARLLARLPGGHAAAALIRRVTPAGHAWLHARYAAYRDAALAPGEQVRPAAPVSWMADGISAEEGRMALRLRPRMSLE
ncbi:FkbM family methyltransferase [Rhodovastum atsumiense]|uniref:FkbM family methyltransferase n=1 Tax=Rhodovastum atsumiense TaxID=504468 RepID=UPI002024B2EA|nr:FkbM family methyltransferase [Rhodovastum atsumiense]